MKTSRCAIYTRKSSEEGLDQSFNSLHAQREACEAYVTSQKHEGWHALSAKYDDGGFSGGNMVRPGLKKLLEDIAAGKIDSRASAAFSDPPFNVRINGHVSGNGQVRHSEFSMASGEMTEAEFTDFLAKSLGLMADYSVAGAVHYICMDWRHQVELLRAGKSIYDELLNVCVWVKNNGGMGSFYRSQHELVFVYRNGGGR